MDVKFEIRFFDSYKFLLSSLDENLKPEQLENINRNIKNFEKRNLLSKKRCLSL